MFLCVKILVTCTTSSREKGLFGLFIFSWVTFDKLFHFRNLAISSKLPNLLSWISLNNCFLLREVWRLKGFPGGSVGKAPTCSAEDLDSVTGLWRSPGEGNGYPLKYSGLDLEIQLKLGWNLTFTLSLISCRSPSLYLNFLINIMERE